MEKLPQNKYVEKVTGYVFDDQEEAVDQAINSASDNVQAALLKEGNNKNADELFEDKVNVVATLKTLITALTRPNDLVVTYYKKLEG